MKSSAERRETLELRVALAEANLETARSALETYDLAGGIFQLREDLAALRAVSIEVPQWVRRQAPALAKLLRLVDEDDELRRRLLFEVGGPCSIRGLARALERVNAAEGESDG